MEDDQQFCLRWNNHQSTLISVFDTLLENQTLVDCTLAAEGKFLKAHKVVLSACSPFFATLLQQQYDKHPIFILKDVKYQELRAMMDYMYRGEVNISQDQLAALLKAAESLQIKGLSDNRSGSTPKTEQHRGLNVPGSGSGGKLSGYTLEQTQSKRPRVGPSSMETTDISGSREGSSSPSRRRRKIRRRSVENAMCADVHDNSNSSQINQSSLQPQPQQPQANASVTGVGAIAAATSSLPVSASSLSTGTSGVLAATGSIVSTQGTTQQMTTNITKKTESVKVASDAMNTENIQAVGLVGTGDEQNLEHVKGDKSNHKQKTSTAGVAGKETAELVIEPKSEYEEEGNEETVEDLTLDDEEMGMDDLDQNAGTSQAGEGSSQGYAPWQHDRSQDELLLAPQETQQRDPQDLRTLYNIATAAAAVVAAASATNAVNIHNKNNQAVVVYNSQRHGIGGDRSDGNQNHHAQDEIVTNNSQQNLTLSVGTLEASPYTTASALSNASTPPQTPAPTAMPLSTAKNVNVLCEVLEPEISIRTMYKCCRSHFLQPQRQAQQQHLQIIQQQQPHNITSASASASATATATATTPPSPSPSHIPVHVPSGIPAPSTPSAPNAHHSSCSGCQISAAASIQLANLIGSSILMPQTAVTVAATMQDGGCKTASTALNTPTNHSAGKNLVAGNADKVMCRASSNAAESGTSSCLLNTLNPIGPSSKASPLLAGATKKATVQFQCEFCAFSCSWKYDLKLHLRQKHGIHNKKI